MQSCEKENFSNFISNIDDQNQKNTIVEFASVIDLTRLCNKTTRIECLKKLYLIYGSDYTHEVLSKSKGELQDYTITVRYPAKLNCSEDELIAVFNSLLPLLSRLRMLRFWVHVREEHSIEYPNVSGMLLILLSISPGTGPLQRSFTKLAKICYKDRCNTTAEHLEVLYLLSSFCYCLLKWLHQVQSRTRV